MSVLKGNHCQFDRCGIRSVVSSYLNREDVIVCEEVNE